MRCFIKAALLFLTIATTAHAKDELLLSIGQQQLVSQGDKIKRLAIGNAAVIDVKTLKGGTELLVTGKAAGSSDLIIWYGRTKKSFSFYVFNRDSPQLLPSLQQFLQQMENVRARQVGKEVWVEGEVLRPTDRYTIHQLIGSNPLIKDMTRMHPEAMRLTLEQLRRLLTDNGFTTLQVTPLNNTIYVEGTVDSATQLKKIQQLLNPIYPEIEYVIDTLYGHGEMIFMDIKMVEMRKNALQKLGIEWQKSITGTFNGSISSQGAESTLRLAEAVPITLNTLEANGLARILSNPKLSCRYDIACKFQAGGEIPIPLIGERTVKVIFKNYGIQLSIVPHLAAEDKLTFAIDIEFSDINYATAVNGIPGLLKNNLQTSAAVRFNHSVILSGLINYRQGKQIDRMPILGNVPVLGELFKSRSFNRDESEFLLVLTPMPITAGDATTEEMIRDNQLKFKQLGDKIRDPLSN